MQVNKDTIFYELIDSLNTKFTCKTPDYKGEMKFKEVYPSAKEGSFLFFDKSQTLYHIICYAWFDSYDKETNEAIFYYKGGLPYYVKISEEDLIKYVKDFYIN